MNADRAPIMSQVRVRAGVNIALVKYWGKASVDGNLPAVGSISMTLKNMHTQTSVSRSETGCDEFYLDGQPVEDRRVFDTINRVKLRAQSTQSLKVESENFVPTASGLASSASGSAALVTGIWNFLTGETDWAQVVDLVRIGSGSAPRSLLGGLVELNKRDGHVSQLCPEDQWDIKMVIAQLSDRKKETSSREGMAHTQATSPYYKPWVDSHEPDLRAARSAIAARDLEKLGAVMEHSTMKMHACMLAANPPLRYWNWRTVQVIEVVSELRRSGIGAWTTMDAGPHVKILCAADDAKTVLDAIKDAGVSLRTSIDELGAGVTLQ